MIKVCLYNWHKLEMIEQVMNESTKPFSNYYVTLGDCFNNDWVIYLQLSHSLEIKSGSEVISY